MTNNARDGTKGKRDTRKGRLLTQIDGRAPWDEWVRPVESKLPPPGCRGRPRTPTITMLRMVVAQRALTMSDRETEDELRLNESTRWFLHTEDVPDRTTLREFRNWLVSEGLRGKIFELLVIILEAKGTIRQEASLVGPALVESPSPTKNREHARDRCARGARKGNVWHFGHFTRRLRPRLGPGAHGRRHRGKRRRHQRGQAVRPEERQGGLPRRRLRRVIIHTQWQHQSQR